MTITNIVKKNEGHAECIHKVRENNYNITKDMTPQKRRDCYNKRGMEVHRQIQERKLQKI